MTSFEKAQGGAALRVETLYVTRADRVAIAKLDNSKATQPATLDRCREWTRGVILRAVAKLGQPEDLSVSRYQSVVRNALEDLHEGDVEGAYTALAAIAGFVGVQRLHVRDVLFCCLGQIDEPELPSVEQLAAMHDQADEDDEVWAVDPSLFPALQLVRERPAGRYVLQRIERDGTPRTTMFGRDVFSRRTPLGVAIVARDLVEGERVNDLDLPGQASALVRRPKLLDEHVIALRDGLASIGHAQGCAVDRQGCGCDCDLIGTRNRAWAAYRALGLKWTGEVDDEPCASCHGTGFREAEPDEYPDELDVERHELRVQCGCQVAPEQVTRIEDDEGRPQ